MEAWLSSSVAVFLSLAVLALVLERWRPARRVDRLCDLSTDVLSFALALAGERPELIETARLSEAGLEFEARSPWPAALEAALALLRQGSMRILISDFLFPHDAAALVRPLAARGRGLALIQVLGAQDVEPAGGAAR